MPTVRPLSPTSTTGRGTGCRRLPFDDQTPTHGDSYGDPAHVERIKKVSLNRVDDGISLLMSKPGDSINF
jgi:hypothetical protein